MSDKTFKPIKTNDLVMHNGQKHLVIAVHLNGDKVHVNLQPLDNQVKTVPLSEVQILDETYRPTKKGLDLRINKSGREAWDYGIQRANLKESKTRNPYTEEELISRVKSLMLDEIRSCGQKAIDQPMLDRVIQKLSATQAYLVKQNLKVDAVKSSDSFIDWRQIALVALKMANMYNQNI